MCDKYHSSVKVLTLTEIKINYYKMTLLKDDVLCTSAAQFDPRVRVLTPDISKQPQYDPKEFK